MKDLNYKYVGMCFIWCGDKILISKRLKKNDYYGYFGVAGGKIEENEDILEGTRREIYEETGAYIYGPSLRLIDCYLLHDKEKKVFLFESVQESMFFDSVKDTEPDKHGPWKLYTVNEALQLKLMPYLEHYLENINVNKLKKIF